MQESTDPNTARAMARFSPLRADSSVGSLFERSHDEPVILFQQDPYCPISHRAYRELIGVPSEMMLVDVARDANISRTIEERTGVSHESPQLLVLRSGRVVWSASNFAITRDSVTRVLRQAAVVQPVEQPESVCGATCGCGGTVLKELSTESLRLDPMLRSAWDGQ